MRSERGQTTAEYVGMLAVVGAVALALVTKGGAIAAVIADEVEQAICVVVDNCEASGGQASGPGELPGSDATAQVPPGAEVPAGSGPSTQVPPGFSTGVGSGAVAADPTATQADPVNSLTGAFETEVTDARLPGPGIAFSFARFYTSDPAALDHPGPLGPGWTHAYAARIEPLENGAVELLASDGQRIRYSHQGDSFSAHPGVRAKLFAAGGGYELRLPGGARQRFDALGRLTAIADRNGNTVGLAYADGALARITDAAGHRIELRSDRAGRLMELRLPDGRTVSYAYDEAGRLAEVTDLRGGTTTYAHDSAGRITEIHAQGGELVVANEYGADGRVVAQTDALGNRSAFAWEGGAEQGSGTQTMTDAAGAEWTDSYENGALVARTDPLGSTSAYTWDDALRLTRATDPAGASWSLAYDQRSNPIRVEGPESEVWRTAYNGLDLPTRITDPAGRTWVAQYDRTGNLLAVTDPAGSTTTAAYDDRGLPTDVTDPLGNTAVLGWDASGQLASATTPSGRRYSFAYDPAGRLIRATDPAGESYRFAWSDADQLLRATDPLGHETELAYDDRGRLTSATDAKGRAATWTYDATGHLTSVTAPDGATTSYAYDPAGRLAQITDPLGGETAFTYDPAGRPVAASGPGGERVTAAYDRAGRLAEVVSAAGNATEAEGDGATRLFYDALGHVAGLDYSDEDTADVRLGYDAAGALSSLVAGESEERYRYDKAGRLTRASLDGDTFAYAYAYDAAGRLTARAYPSGERTEYAYDPDDRLAAAETPAGAVSYAYDAAGRLARSTLPNGARTLQGYDAAGRLTRLRHLGAAGEEIARLRYAYDATGNPTSVASDAGRVLYAYDERDRLAGTCLDAPCAEGDPDLTTYSYDPLGNILTTTTGAETTSYSYDASSRIESASGPAGEVTYDHDPDGNLARAGERTYAYDQAGRVVSVGESGAEIAAYGYDAAGRRTSVVYPQGADGGSTGAGELEWLWDPGYALPQLAEERTGDGKLLRRYSYAAGRIAQQQDGDTSYFHPDRLGSAVALSDEDGNRTSRQQFDPYGTPSSGAATGKPETPFAFTGEYLDQTTGLYHLRARDFDPTTARFLSVDPISAPVGAPARSPYAYVGGRPTTFTDPSGMVGMPQLPTIDPLGAVSDGWDATGGALWDESAGIREDLGLNAAGAAIGGTAEDVFHWAGENADTFGLIAGGIGVGVCTVSTGGLCAGLGIAAAGSGVLGSGYNSGVLGPGEANWAEFGVGSALSYFPAKGVGWMRNLDQPLAIGSRTERVAPGLLGRLGGGKLPLQLAAAPTLLPGLGPHAKSLIQRGGLPLYFHRGKVGGLGFLPQGLPAANGMLGEHAGK